jgi:26S proteasome regulatory subunit RPN2 C-terminal domain
VTPAQRQYVKFPQGSRFQPIKPGARTGVMVLVDTQPEQPIEYVERQSVADGATGDVPGGTAVAAADTAAAGGAAANTGTAVPATAAEPDAPEDMDYEE